MNERYSTAGPTAAYEYWAKTASSLIIDNVVTSPLTVTELTAAENEDFRLTQAIWMPCTKLVNERTSNGRFKC
ncbi:hypothetical protein KHA80_14485 [Anaerobacillus sp. HL2]|nr:hypothetical protein KHA80_14485 [Anaerobacillus sp. HL2]